MKRLLTVVLCVLRSSLLCFVLTSGVFVVGVRGAQMPNVIFVLTDDLGYSDVGCYGATKVKTPHIDQLAAGGIRFTDFHTAASICSPSRAAFLTGGYPQRAGLYMGINPNRTAHWFLGLHPDEITITEQFKQWGYATHMVGKWHLGTEPEFLPRRQGFDTYYGMPCNFSHSPKFFDDDEEVFEKTPLDQLTELYTERVTKIIREHDGEPFFLYYAHNYPHTPYQAGEKFKKSSKDGVRGDIMQELDWGIGEMMKALKTAGIADNTIVIFTSDNGPTKNVYAKPYRGTKYVTFEGGHRVPFIFHWPDRIRRGSVSDVSIHAMDLFPTLSEIIGAPLPKGRVYDGESLLPMFEGKTLNRRADAPFYYYNCENLQAVRSGDWKLHLPREQKQLPFWDRNKAFINVEGPVLYNLDKDRAETTDVASSHPKVVEQMLEIAASARQDLGEFMRRGKAQRPTGSLFPEVPVISHEKDWGQVSATTAMVIEKERRERHPDWTKKQPRRKKRPRPTADVADTKIKTNPARILPNVVLVFADDLGYGDLGCYGATKVKTPNIDRLATEGRRFTDAHSASAVCTPSRYALLTGEYPFRKGIWGPCSHRQPLLIDTNKLTLARMFKNAGYATSCFGKWHLGFGTGPTDWAKPLKPGPLEVGFDYYFGVPKVNSGFPYVYVENHHVFGGDPKDPLVYDQKPYSPTPTFPAAAGRKSPNRFGGAKKAHELYHDERVGTDLAERTTKWIDAQASKPFFLYLATTHIHHPTTPAPRFKGTSQAGLYGDYIHELDWMVGELLACLERNQIADDTIFIFTSDNGGMFNTAGQIAFKHGHKINGDLLGFKFGAWEGGHRVPFLVRWPGKVKAGTTSDQLISNIDLLATFAAMTGQKLTKQERADSVNLLPAITGDPQETIRQNLILAPNKRSHLSVRKGKWMYIPNRGNGGFTGKKPGDHTFAGPSAASFVGSKNSDFENGKFKPDAPLGQLYDLEFDPNQTKNLYREYPEVVAELGAFLQQQTVKLPAKPKRAGNRKSVESKYDNVKPLGNLRFTFESGKLDTWKIAEGKVGRAISDHVSLPRHPGRPFNREGKYHLTTVETADGFADQQQVVIQSPAFVIHGDRASFLASGGFKPGLLYVGLIDAKTKKVLRSAGGPGGPQMQRNTWDVSKLKGRTVYLQVVDRSPSGWGHLTFDDFSVEGELKTDESR